MNADTSAFVTWKFCSALVAARLLASSARPLVALLLVAPADEVLPSAAAELFSSSVRSGPCTLPAVSAAVPISSRTPAALVAEAGAASSCVATTLPWPDCAFCTVNAALACRLPPLDVAPLLTGVDVAMSTPPASSRVVARLP